MNSFRLQLRDTRRHETIDGVCAFIGEDASGSFGVLARHARFMTVLVFGLARFKANDESWQYLALPGGLLYFTDNEMRINTRRYFRHADYATVSRDLLGILSREEQELLDIKRSLRRLEEHMLRYMLEYESRAAEL